MDHVAVDTGAVAGHHVVEVFRMSERERGEIKQGVARDPSDQSRIR